MSTPYAIGVEFRERMNDEEQRVATFRCPMTNYSIFPRIEGVSIYTLAAHGFYFVGPEDRVRCNFCSVELYQFQPYDDIAYDHKRFSPHCPLINNHQNTRNILKFSADTLERDLNRTQSGLYRVARQRLAIRANANPNPSHANDWQIVHTRTLENRRREALDAITRSVFEVYIANDDIDPYTFERDFPESSSSSRQSVQAEWTRFHGEDNSYDVAGNYDPGYNLDNHMIRYSPPGAIQNYRYEQGNHHQQHQHRETANRETIRLLRDNENFEWRDSPEYALRDFNIEIMEPESSSPPAPPSPPTPPTPRTPPLSELSRVNSNSSFYVPINSQDTNHNESISSDSSSTSSDLPIDSTSSVVNQSISASTRFYREYLKACSKRLYGKKKKKKKNKSKKKRRDKEEKENYSDKSNNKKKEKKSKHLLNDDDDDDDESKSSTISNKICTVCYDKEYNTLLIPCSHLCCCEECSKNLPTCPQCRQKISATAKVFLA